MRKLLIGSLVVLSACGESASTPTTPTPAANLSVSAASLTIARNASEQVVATSTPEGGPATDVSAEAVWTTSNPAVATVTAGRITATGLGDARIDVTYRGTTRSISVTGRRNTRLVGTLFARDADNRASLSESTVSLGGRRVGVGFSLSDHGPTSWTPIYVGQANFQDIANAVVAPGDYELVVSFRMFWRPADGYPVRVVLGEYPHAHNGLQQSKLDLVDADTGEILETLAAPPAETTILSSATSDQMRFPISVRLFKQ